MNKNLEKVKLLAPDLRNGKQFPRSPRATLAGYVLAPRAVDKCRAVLVGWEGEYHSNCPLDQRWLKSAEIDYETSDHSSPPARPMMRLLRGLVNMQRSVRAPRSSPGTIKNETCI
jgi:uncharacterized protein DUF5069